MMRKRDMLVLVAVLSFFIVSPVGAVTNGLPDGNNHPYVGLSCFLAGSIRTTIRYRCGAVQVPFCRILSS